MRGKIQIISSQKYNAKIEEKNNQHNSKLIAITLLTYGEKNH
jgi:hypothetical protein